jgi:hypothetical protein
MRDEHGISNLADAVDEAMGRIIGRIEEGQAKPIRIVRLDCWHANCLIYQADGETDDGRHVYVRYRRPYFSVGVGDTPDDAAGADTFRTDAHPDHWPCTITRATLQAWTSEGLEEPAFTWPERVDGYSNESGTDPCYEHGHPLP